MSILKALQKKSTETGGEFVPHTLFLRPDGRRQNTASDMPRAIRSRRYTSSAFNGQPGSPIGTASLIWIRSETAGAKLNAEP